MPVVLISSLGTCGRARPHGGAGRRRHPVLLSLHDAWQHGRAELLGRAAATARCACAVRVLLLFGAVFLFIAHALAMAAARWPPHRQLRHAAARGGVEAGGATVVFGFFVARCGRCCGWAQLFMLVKLDFLRTL
jgi:hypothetical protein